MSGQKARRTKAVGKKARTMKIQLLRKKVLCARSATKNRTLTYLKMSIRRLKVHRLEDHEDGSPCLLRVCCVHWSSTCQTACHSSHRGSGCIYTSTLNKYKNGNKNFIRLKYPMKIYTAVLAQYFFSLLIHQHVTI